MPILPLSSRESTSGPVLQGRACTQHSLHCESSEPGGVSDPRANMCKMALPNYRFTMCSVCISSFLHFDDSGCGRGVSVPRVTVLMLLLWPEPSHGHLRRRLPEQKHLRPAC